MNFHKTGMERGLRGHDTGWLDQATTQAVDKIRTEYLAGDYKGNAHKAVTDLLVAAYTAGNAGQGCRADAHAKHLADDPKASCNSMYWAFWILCICREMLWYDFGALSADERKARLATRGQLSQDLFIAQKEVVA